MTTLSDLGKSASPFAKQVFMADAKMGKTTWLVSSLLGALPHQTGAVVSAPENLHLVGFDESFADGLSEFIVGMCKRDPKLLGVTVHDLSELRRKSGLQGDWDFNFSNAIHSTTQKILAATSKPGVHAVVVSSLSGMNEGLYTGLAGMPGQTTEAGKVSKGGGMDQSKWQDLERQVIAIRNRLQVNQHHVFWEAHIHHTRKMEGSGEVTVEELKCGRGDGGKQFGVNVDFVFRLRREPAKFDGTSVDKVFVDTKPQMGTFSTGRKASLLADKETDLVQILTKLGKSVHGKPL